MNEPQVVTNGKQSAVARAQRLEQVLSQATDKSHVILLGGHPDPDAIGSACHVGVIAMSPPCRCTNGRGWAWATWHRSRAFSAGFLHLRT